ncbi:MAG: glycoside hydrolase family 19 protein [Thalassovita sp.]
MQILTYSQLDKITGGKLGRDNANSFLAGLNRFGGECGLMPPHRLAQYVAQMCHESQGFRYDQEVWGPTAAQKRYDVRTDLGNSPEVDGDGYTYRGRTGLQLTGRTNYAAFTRWAQGLDAKAPDFVAHPDAVLTDPWEGLAPIWYWSTRNLNEFASKQRFKVAFKGVTRAINGGLNGYTDRLRYYRRAALVLLGFEPDDVLKFQKGEAGLVADGVCGPLTLQALHEALINLPPISQRRGFWSALWATLSKLFKQGIS